MKPWSRIYHLVDEAYAKMTVYSKTHVTVVVCDVKGNPLEEADFFPCSSKEMAKGLIEELRNIKAED